MLKIEDFVPGTLFYYTDIDHLCEDVCEVIRTGLIEEGREIIYFKHFGDPRRVLQFTGYEKHFKIISSPSSIRKRSRLALIKKYV